MLNEGLSVLNVTVEMEIIPLVAATTSVIWHRYG